MAINRGASRKVRVTPYKETHQQGNVLVSKSLERHTSLDCDFGIQIASDGRVWVCIDGVTLLRFKPYPME